MTFDEAHRAIKTGDLARLRKELDNGLNPNLANQNFWTLLMLAAVEGNTSIGRLFIQQGADFGQSKQRSSNSSFARCTHGPPFIRQTLA